jgi:hypothetical protein
MKRSWVLADGERKRKPPQPSSSSQPKQRRPSKKETTPQQQQQPQQLQPQIIKAEEPTSSSSYTALTNQDHILVDDLLGKLTSAREANVIPVTAGYAVEVEVKDEILASPNLQQQPQPSVSSTR